MWFNICEIQRFYDSHPASKGEVDYIFVAADKCQHVSLIFPYDWVSSKGERLQFT